MKRRLQMLNGLSKNKVLTNRELEILMEVVSGKTNKEICLNLTIAEGTLDKHIHHIYRKIGVRNRVEATNYVNQNTGFLP
jgi:LuxR family transcriptional regulator of csgAB operon